jgi:hypothetical protein
MTSSAAFAGFDLARVKSNCLCDIIPREVAGVPPMAGTSPAMDVPLSSRQIPAAG